MIRIKVTTEGGVAKCRVKTRCIGKKMLAANITAALGAIRQVVKEHLPEITPEELMEMARKAEDDGAVVKVEDRGSVL